LLLGLLTHFDFPILDCPHTHTSAISRDQGAIVIATVKGRSGG